MVIEGIKLSGDRIKTAANEWRVECVDNYELAYIIELKILTNPADE
jgi:hypothetical protein